MERKVISNHTKVFSIILSAAIVLLSTSTIAELRMEMDGTAIIGNKELPKVLYIVPWKSSEPVSLATPEFKSVLDESFQPIDRASFQREIKFHEQLHDLPEQK